MSKKSFHILDFVSEVDILAVLNRLGNENLTPTGHGYEIVGAVPIRQASEQSTLSFTDKSKEKPAIALLSVILAANREYNRVVEPNLRRIEKECPDLKTFQSLSEILSSKSKEDFYLFWGHKDEKKYSTLKNILTKIEELRRKYPIAENDFDLMNHWGLNADLFSYKHDIIGSIPNIALATFQHLRMVFGVDTVKPDQRVKEVLNYEFGLSRLTDERAINAVEKIASIASLSVVTVDQILVKYGSSYYNQRSNKLTLKQIVQNLKSHGVDNEIISKSTLLSLGQIERL